MKNSIPLLIVLTLLFSIKSYSQIAPTGGKKVLEVKETYEGEYQKQVTKADIHPNVLVSMKKNVIKKSAKFGFTDITIEEVGQVSYPSSSTSSENNFKFQANIIDNSTKNKYKLRISIMGHAPKYIIKEVKSPKLEVVSEQIVEKEDVDYCSKITKSVDNFDKKTNYYSPFSGLISFSKTIGKGKDDDIYISITAKSSSFNTGKYGVSILFKDETRIDRKSEEIKVKMGKGKYFDYKAFFLLTEDEINKLTTSEITDIKLYVYTEEIKNGAEIMEYLKCLSDIK